MDYSPNKYIPEFIYRPCCYHGWNVCPCFYEVDGLIKNLCNPTFITSCFKSKNNNFTKIH